MGHLKALADTAPLQKRWAHPGNCCWHSTAKPSLAVPEQEPHAALCPCREAVLDTVTSRAGRCQVLPWCFRACLLAPSLTSASLRCAGWLNSLSTHRMTPQDLSEGHFHPQQNYSVLFSLPSWHLISLKEYTVSDRSLPSLNWPSTASSAPLSKVATGDRQTNCECQ